MFDGHINYTSVAYSMTKSFIDENSAIFYLYWKDRISNINITNLSIVDKVFVLMCREKAIGGAMFGLLSSDIRNTMHCKNCGAKW